MSESVSKYDESEERNNLSVEEEHVHTHLVATMFNVPCLPESEQSHLHRGRITGSLLLREKHK